MNEPGADLVVPGWVLALRGLKLGERMVLAVLVSVGEAGRVSCAALADQLGIGERTARRALEELDERGLISLRRAGPQGYKFEVKSGQPGQYQPTKAARVTDIESGQPGRSTTEAVKVTDIETGQSDRYPEKPASLADIETGQGDRFPEPKAANLADIDVETGQGDRFPPQTPPLRDQDLDLSEGGPGGGPVAADVARLEAALPGVSWAAVRELVRPPSAAGWRQLLEQLSRFPAPLVAESARRLLELQERPGHPGRYLVAMVRRADDQQATERRRQADRAERERQAERAERKRERQAERDAVAPPPGLVALVHGRAAPAPPTKTRDEVLAERHLELRQQAEALRPAARELGS